MSCSICFQSLKPFDPSNPIRPLVLENSAPKSNALDALDSTLASFASSLGGSAGATVGAVTWAAGRK
ncbi:unnamed protein product [Protopolystoma xenopodis]|uniref:Uncharacterized protein n=1 Tax=Protopolystoma xenopodis TaxID=117903 RepID=A0A3S5A5X5_9PLAT|nr:unnamed protein product [Protopolystoma xenopodis]